MIVVDTNVLAALYLPSPHSNAVERLMERESEWAAPVLWRSEFRSVLTGYLRRGALGFETARQIQAEAEDLMRPGEYDVESMKVFDLVRQTDCSAYDCEFAALAMALGCRLVTMDRQLLRAFPKVAVRLTG